MRNISFAMTVDQIRNQTKTVTRRLMWSWLKPGDELQACVKCMGLKKGEKIEKLCVIVVTDVRRERLDAMNIKPYGDEEAIKEGFPNMTGWAFVNYFCDNMNCEPNTLVTRIEFKYKELLPQCCCGAWADPNDYPEANWDRSEDWCPVHNPR